MSAPTSSTPASASSGHRTLDEILAGIPKTAAAVSAALAALVPVLLPDRLVPQQLSILRPATSLFIIVAFFVGWIYQRGLRRKRAAFAWMGALAATVLVVIQILYVQELPAIGIDKQTEYHLIGYSLTAHGQEMLRRAGALDTWPQLLREVGPDTIPALYGVSYQIVALAYTASMLLFVFSLVLLLTTSDTRTPQDSTNSASVSIAVLALFLLGLQPCVVTAQAPSRRALSERAVAVEDQARSALGSGVTSKMARALTLFREAEALRLRAGDSVMAARNHGRIGIVHSALGNLDSANAYYDQTLTRQRQLRDSVGEGRTRLNRGLVFIQKSEPHAAIPDLRSALATARRVQDREDEELALYNLGWAFNLELRQSRAPAPALYDSAARYLRETFATARSIPDTGMLANAHSRLASLHQEQSQLDSAIAHYEIALQLYKIAPNPPRKADALFGIGSVYASLRRHELALKNLREARELYADLEDEVAMGMTDTKIVAVESDRADVLIGGGHGDSIAKDWATRNKVDSMESVGDRAMKVLRSDSIHASGANRAEAERLRVLSESDPEMAGSLAGLLLARSTKDRQTEGLAFEGVAGIYMERDSTRLALAYLDSTLTDFRVAKDRFGEVRTLTSIGWVHHRLEKNLGAAVVSYTAADSVRARMSAVAGNDPNRVSLHDQDVNLFSAWALATLGNPRQRSAPLEALAVVERGRAQALLALLQRPDSAQTQRTRTAFDAARLVREGNGVPRLIYWLAEDTLLVWLVDARGAVTLARRSLNRPSMVKLLAKRDAHFQTLGRRLVGREALLEAVDKYRRVLADTVQGSRDSVASVGRAVADLLLPSEIRRRLPSSGEIVIVPFGALGLLPFAALPLGDGDPFGTRYAIRYAPSLRVHNAVAVRSDGRVPAGFPSRPLIAGNVISPPVIDSLTGAWMWFGRLEGAEATARWLGDRLTAPALIGEQATETAVRAGIGSADLVDLETHAYAYAGPELARHSFLTLTADARNDGVLSVSEVLDSLPPLHANLVVLSACQTGLGDPREAEGIIGLARAALARGAGGVLISLWSVDDKATGELVRSFYRAWLGPSHPTKAEALRSAQAVVRQTHPDARHWAAFQLVGR